MHKQHSYTTILLYVTILLVFFLASCSPTRRLPEGEYLLNKTRIKIDEKAIEENDLEPYEKQSPNKTIFGIKFYLFLYNLANPEKEKGISSWLRKIGEEPVVWNPVLTERTTDQFHRYLEAKGYYDNVVTDSVKLFRGRANVSHSIELNEPFRIRNISYSFEDQGLQKYVLNDTVNSLLKTGNRFDKEVLQAERIRVENELKEAGFYLFSKEYIFYEAREVPEEKLVDLKMIFKENISGIPDPVTKVKEHHRYKINSVTIYPDFTPISEPSEENYTELDTVIDERSIIVYSGKRRIRPESLLLPNRCQPDSILRLSAVKNSYTSYSSLGLFRIINIHFNKLEAGMSADTSDFRYMDCFIELSPRKFQSYQTEMVGTHSAGDFGGRVNFVYNNYNLLRGAENFQLKLTGAIEDVSHRISAEEARIQLMEEIGVESSLSLPKFLVPFKAEKFTRRYNPRTVLNLSYNYQNRPDYIRTIASTSLSYRWKSSPYITHQFFPLDFNYVQLPQGSISDDLWEDISGTALITSFSDHTILAARYTFEFTNQIIEKKTDFVYFRASIESAGNLINLGTNLASLENDTTFLKVPYLQYLKGEIDLRIHDQIDQDNKWVYRIFAGLGYPLGKSDVLPLEKMYFGGGPSGVRAWRSYALGPGADTSQTVSFATKLGDIRLEANIEYRFKLFWKLEGAWFIDMGNVWRLNDTRYGTNFGWNTFYKEIAVGTGIGGRFDFSFLIIRLDVGYKLRDPAISSGNRWIDFNNNIDYPFRKRLNFQVGIGYPF